MKAIFPKEPAIPLPIIVYEEHECKHTARLIALCTTRPFRDNKAMRDSIEHILSLIRRESYAKGFYAGSKVKDL